MTTKTEARQTPYSRFGDDTVERVVGWQSAHEDTALPQAWDNR